METLVVHTDTNNMRALKELLSKMQIPYNIFSDAETPYNKEFMQKLDQSIKEGQEGKTKFVKTEDLWK